MVIIVSNDSSRCLTFMEVKIMQLNSSFKGFPAHYQAIEMADIQRHHWNVLKGDLSLPLAVLKHSSIEHNLQWMKNFCLDRGIDIAPHGKTTMSPELYAKQIAAGAWGITFANVFQAGVGVRCGIQNIIIANQVFQSIDLDTLSQFLSANSRLKIFFLVDSHTQIKAIENWKIKNHSKTIFNVLLEVGIDGHRTGCRTHAQGLQLAQAIHQSPALALSGIACYEGGLVTCDHAHDQAGVNQLMARVHQLALACENNQWFEHEEVLITAGGSAVFDLVAQNLKPSMKTKTRSILRSGCYLTHDHQRYEKSMKCIAERLHLKETLRPAIELIAGVQSCPEPGLALLTMGKRDVSHDLDLPQPIWRANVGDLLTSAVPDHWVITQLNDQHAYLKYNALSPNNEHPEMGQVVGFGISHPCTTFDKWRWMPIVDDDYQVIEAIGLHF